MLRIFCYRLPNHLWNVKIEDENNFADHYPLHELLTNVLYFIAQHETFSYRIPEALIEP